MTRFVIISDLHNKLKDIKIPTGDALVICGDLTIEGKPWEIIQFGNELNKLPHEEILVVPGNHDILFEKDFNYAKSLVGPRAKVFHNQSYIHEKTGLEFYFSASTTRFYDWAFNIDRGPLMAQEWAKIPDSVNVLVTHGMPYKFGDYIGFNRPRTHYDVKNFEGHAGDQDLAARIKNLPNLKGFWGGHLHQGYTAENRDGVIYVNAAILNDKYKIQNKPVILDFNGKNFEIVDFGRI